LSSREPVKIRIVLRVQEKLAAARVLFASVRHGERVFLVAQLRSVLVLD